MSSRVLIVSAESSSALYALRLLQEWKARGRSVNAFGVGDRAMRDFGFEAIGRSEDMAVVGIREVLKHYKDIKKVFYSILEECDREKPEFALLLDYPDFNFRLAKELKKRNIKVIYYISPQLWAWRKSRLKLVQKYIDKMLVLFPFEKDFYTKNGVEVEFVGHPLLAELAGPDLSAEKITEFRSRLGIESTDLLIGLLPGSRSSEIDHHLLPMMEAAQELYQKYPSVKMALLVAPNLDMEWMKQKLPQYNFPLVLMQEDPTKMARTLDMALTASGTATLVLGLAACPMVVIYKMSGFSAWMAKRFVKGVSFFTMVNLIFSKMVVPEFFQEKANTKNIVDVLSNWIENPDSRIAVKNELSKLENMLGQKGATGKVADALEGYFN